MTSKALIRRRPRVARSGACGAVCGAVMPPVRIRGSFRMGPVAEGRESTEPGEHRYEVAEPEALASRQAPQPRFVTGPRPARRSPA
jgi:hypothetical protein